MNKSVVRRELKIPCVTHELEYEEKARKEMARQRKNSHQNVQMK